MYWTNTDSLRNSNDDHSHHANSQQRPAKRWGQSCVAAHNKLYIIGGYEGMNLAMPINMIIDQYSYRSIPWRCMGI